MRRNQAINMALSRTLSATNTGGLEAALTGATNDAVLLFVAGDVILGQGIAVTSVAGPAANDGTTISITSPGVYEVELGYRVQASSTVVGGITLNGAAASLNSTPAFANAGTLDVNLTTLPAATLLTVKLTTTVRINRALAGAAGGALLRFVATDAADAAPAGILAASAYYRVTRVAELYQ